MSLLTDLIKEIPHSVNLLEKVRKLEESHAGLETENAILKDDLRKLRNDNQKLKGEIERLTLEPDLDETSKKILSLIANRYYYAQLLVEALGLHAERVEYYLVKLIGQDYVRAEFTAPIPSYELTQKGRDFLIKNDVI